ncbi:MAG: hypothetical protein MUO50_20190 [Longimicrobiales bacterium]|nr:hypothetical protein [Longimicrobiales bacterium]
MIENQLALLPPGQGPGTLLQRAGQEYDAHGHPEEARELWERALGWYAGRPAEEVETETNRRQRAWFLLYLDRLEEAERLLVPLVSETPGDVASRGLLGILKAKQADREGAEQVSQALAAWDPPVRNGGGSVWQARIAAQLGELDEAVRLLERAMEEGWSVRDNPHRDPFLKPLRGHPAFEEFMRPKG